MSDLTLVRIHKDYEGTLGKLMLGFELFCFTLELPWKNNVENMSCTPIGVYKYKKYHSETYKRECLMIMDVPGRSDIRVHQGNYLNETEGCILIGTNLGVDCVLNSNRALDSLLREIDSKGEFEIK